MDYNYVSKIAALAILDTVHSMNDYSSLVDKNSVQQLSATFFDIPGINSGILAKFDTFFPAQITFVSLQKYMAEFLKPTPPTTSRSSIDLMNDAVNYCWNEAKKHVKSKFIHEKELAAIWQIYLRLVNVNNYPLVSYRDSYRHFFDSIEKATYLNTLQKHALEKPLTFKEMISEIDTNILNGLDYKENSPFAITIKKCKEFYVDQIYFSGWLYKRTKKNANWTGWKHRYFVLTQENLQYFEEEGCKSKKGEFPFYTSTSISELDHLRQSLKNRLYRFHLQNGNDLTMELSAASENCRREWLQILLQVISSNKNGTTLIEELTTSLDHVDIKDNKVKDKKEGNEDHDNSMIKKKKDHVTTKNPVTPKNDEMADVIDNYKTKFKAIFLELDTDKSGFIDKSEFRTFLHNLGTELSDEEFESIFLIIDQDKNGKLCLTEFIDYFVNSVEGFVTGDKIPEEFLMKAFSEADRSGKGAINFKDFMEFILEKNQDVKAKQIVSCFQSNADQMENGEKVIGLEGFKGWLEQQELNMLFDGADVNQLKVKSAILGLTKNVNEGTQLKKHLLSRWEAFSSFKRMGANEKVVMKGGHGMVDDVLPGNYTLLDLAAFSDLPSIKPEYVEVKVDWVSGLKEGKAHGQLIFPHDFDKKIPVQTATDPLLRYYGCSFADGATLEVSLLYRHGIQDFTYENSYMEQYVLNDNMLGGSGVERHDFTHLDCPLVDDSGFFILAKLEDDTMHLSAFKVPKRHTLYIPSYTIHSNDYLKGTWRTMLSDESPIDHVQLYQKEIGNGGPLKTITFEFLQPK